jgi:hypothetical protein
MSEEPKPAETYLDVLKKWGQRAAQAAIYAAIIVAISFATAFIQRQWGIKVDIPPPPPPPPVQISVTPVPEWGGAVITVAQPLQP